MVSDVPLTVAVAVWMRAPELLTVGVVPPLPYPFPYPLPYLPLLLVGVLPAEVLEVAFGAAVDPVLVPTATSCQQNEGDQRQQGEPGSYRSLCGSEVALHCVFLSSIVVIRVRRTKYEVLLLMYTESSDRGYE